MKWQFILVITLITFCLLLLGDIITRYWFWSELNLRFDAENFNNIVTPIASIVTFLSVGLALFLAYRQNQISLSQHIIRHYEKKYESLKAELQHTFVMIDPSVYKPNGGKRLNAFNYTSMIGELLTTMKLRDREYKEDIKAFTEEKRYSIGFYEGRSYYETVLALYPYLTGQALDELNYHKVKSLLLDIDSSELIAIDKKHLTELIKLELVSQYIALIDRIDKYPNAFAMLPNFLQLKDDSSPVEMISFSKSGFRKYYDDFKK